MPAARALAADFPETVVHRDPSTVLHSRHGRRMYQQHSKNDLDNPTGLRLRWFTLSTLVKHWLHTPHPANVAQPEVEFGKGDAYWWRLPLFDSALVSAADGSGKNIYTRDRRKYRRMLFDTVALHARLRRRWPELSRRYRDAMGELTSLESWRKTFEEPK